MNQPKKERFPVGGYRLDVYNFLRSKGFVESRHSDKEWHRHDGLRLHLYGAGSRARIYDGNVLMFDDALAMAVARADCDA